MKCVVPGANVRILAKAIHALSKIGDEMYVEPQKNSLSFRTVNLSNSAYADFTLFENYFSYYIYGDLQEDDALKCKISMRSAMAVFKAPNLIDKQVETCHIRLDPEASEILFILKYKNGITKTHLLPILDCEVLQTVYNKDSAPNQVLSQPRVLGDAILNFHQNLIELTLEVSPQKLLLRNYVDETTGISNTTRTQLVLGVGEFDRYTTHSETTITFCMKEFRALLAFAETVGTPVSIYFEAAGRPVVFSLNNSSFEANLVLSTLRADADSQTDTTLIGKQEKSAKRKAPSHRQSRRGGKPSSKTENRSIKLSKTTESIMTKNTRPSIIEEKKDLQENIPECNTSGKHILNEDTIDKNVMRHTLMDEDCQEEYESDSMCHTVNSKHSTTSKRGKILVNSIFSTITKRKSSSNDVSRQKKLDQEDSNILEDAVPNSPPPPAKKARLIFQKCFQTTFDPKMLPGYNVILAEDSDEYCSD